MKKCIKCQSEIENNAKTCIHCGYVQPTKSKAPIVIICGIILFAIMVIFAVYNNKNSNTNYSTSSNDEVNIEETTGDNQTITKPNDSTIENKEPIKVYEFYGSTCSFCLALNNWFDSIENEYGMYYNLIKYEVWNDSYNKELMQAVADELDTTVQGVPFVIIGDNYVFGFSESSTPNTIIGYIMDEYNKNEEDRIDIINNIKNK